MYRRVKPHIILQCNASRSRFLIEHNSYLTSQLAMTPIMLLLLLLLLLLQLPLFLALNDAILLIQYDLDQ